MTQTASSPRGHQLTVSGHGVAALSYKDRLPDAYQHLAPAVPALLGPEAGLEVAAGEELLSAVWRTSSYLETVQWELDAAHESLRQAVQRAAHSGIGRGELLQAANMTSEELETALTEALPVYPAAY